MNERVRYQVENGVARVQLDRPDKHNALDLAMFEAIEAAQRRARRDPGVRAVVLCGAGVDFCSGLDVKSTKGDRVGMLRLLWKAWPGRANLAQRVSVGWRRLPVPVVAAVHGRCWGGGLQIALGADFRWVAPDASLSIMESRWGLIPDMGGTLALRDLVGRDQAMKLAMTAEEFDGRRALALGLATAVEENPLAGAEAFARQLAERPAGAVRLVKRLFEKSWTGSAGAALARESAYQVRILSRLR